MNDSTQGEGLSPQATAILRDAAEPTWWDRQAREGVWAWTSRIYATLSDTARRADDEAAARPEGSEPAGELRAAREAALWAAGNAVGATARQDRGANRDVALHKPLWLDGTRNAALLDGIKGPGKPPPRPVTSRAAEHAAAAESQLCCPGSPASVDARAITHALLAVAAAIGDAAERQAEDTDTVGAMLDDRLTSIEGAIDAVTAAPVPLYRRVCFRLRNRRARSRQEAGHSSGSLRPGP